MSSPLPPPIRPGLGTTFKRPITELTVGVAPNGQVIIDDSIPQILMDKYSPNPLSGATIRLYPGDGSYDYIVAGVDLANGNAPFLATGVVSAGATTPADVAQYTYGFRIASTDVTQMNIGDSAHDFRVIFDSNFTSFGGGTLAGNILVSGHSTFEGDVQIDTDTDSDFVSSANADMGRGIIFWEETHTDVNTGAVSGTVYEVYNSGNINFQKGRVFEVSLVGGQLASASVQFPTVSLRKTNAAGTVLESLGRDSVDTTGSNMGMRCNKFLFCNSTAGTVSAALSLCISPSVATLVTMKGNTGANQWYFIVRDVGSLATLIGNDPVSV